jgi:hypothetical protein
MHAVVTSRPHASAKKHASGTLLKAHSQAQLPRMGHLHTLASKQQAEGRYIWECSSSFLHHSMPVWLDHTGSYMQQVTSTIER